MVPINNNSFDLDSTLAKEHANTCDIKKCDYRKLAYNQAIQLTGIPIHNHFKSIQVRFPHVDPTGINISRVCYESVDENIYINEHCKVWDDYIEEKQYEVVHEKIEITEAVRDDYEKYKRILTWLENRNDAFVSGQRNLFIFKLAAACCRFGIDMYVAEGFIATDFLGRDSDFSRNEAIKAIESATKLTCTNKVLSTLKTIRY
jgi:hypothetical protein